MNRPAVIDACIQELTAAHRGQLDDELKRSRTYNRIAETFGQDTAEALEGAHSAGRLSETMIGTRDAAEARLASEIVPELSKAHLRTRQLTSGHSPLFELVDIAITAEQQERFE